VQLSNSGAPVGKLRALTVSPEMEAAAVEFGAALFNPPKTISEQYLSGTMGIGLGFKWSMDQNVTRFTTGAFTLSVPTMTTAANQSGSSILTTGWTASTQVLNRGDIISILGVNSVNPISYRDTGVLRTFVVTADVTSGSGAGAATVNISPPISADPTDPFQTVAALPAASASIKIWNSTVAATITAMSAVSSPQALAFHRDAFTLVVVQLETPGGLDWSERVTNPKIGLSMRLTRGFIMGTNRRITRLDVLGGCKTLRPELACRIPG